MSGDDSEESQSKRQQLQESLREAEENLKETEYEKYLSDSEQLLDKMFEDYETILNERLDNIDGLLQEMIDYTNANSETINTTIGTAADKVGYDVTEGMKGIWNATDSGINKIVTDFNSSFTTTLTTTNDYIKKVYDLINQSVKKSEDEKKENTTPAADIDVTTTAPATPTTPETTPPTTPPSTQTSPTTSTDSGSKFKHSFFKYKKDSYNKSKLNINTSIVDRLKYNDINPAWNYMKQYYAGMGLGSSSSYAGSYKQNVAMLNWMKKNGYSGGGTIGKLINASGEDGFVLAKEGEHILNKEQLSIASAMVDKLLDFAKLQPNTNAIKGMSYTNNSENNITMNVTLPSVTNYNEFVDQLQKDKRFEKIVQSATIGQALGKSSLDKLKHK